MKKIFSIATCLLILTTAVNAQEDVRLSFLLNEYYNIKNALVAGDAIKAGSGAAQFVKAINAVDAGTLISPEQKSFLQLKDKLAADGSLIAGSKEINKQRELFAALSNNMISLAKAAKLSAKEVYVDYCPMKKVYWLSAEKAVKNPYYGNSMLTCGSVKETIQ